MSDIDESLPQLDKSNRGWECVGYSEIDKYCSQLLSNKFVGVHNWGDATKIDASQLPDFDMLVGGFPCQAFSIAGKRRGFEDTRGTLFFEVARILETKRPTYCVLENVKGLLNHNKGETFRVIIQTLCELGYNVQWMVLNSKFHGVPQNRERVFIIGSARGKPRLEVLPFRCGGTAPNTAQQQVSSTIGAGYYKCGGRDQQYVSGELNQIAHLGNNSMGQRVYDSDGIATSVRSEGGCQGAKTGLYAITRGRTNEPYRESDTAPTLRAKDKADIRAVLTPNRAEKRQNGRQFKESGEEMFTLTGQDQHGVMVQVHNMQPRDPNRPSLQYSSGGSGHLQRDDIAYCVDTGNTNAVEFSDMKIRRLTPVECERLQGFPDGWTAGFSDTQRYKMCGNAVTVNVIKAIFSNIYGGLNGGS